MFSRGIVAAMESEAQSTELAIDEAGSESMEADLVETVDMAADIDSGTNEVEQTIKDAGQLERHVEVLTDAEGEGGAAPEVIEATEIAVEGICSRLGIYGGTGIPALESFSTKTGRQRNTRIAIESIGEKIKQIWEAVKMAFKKLVNYVKDFFAKLFDANAKMLARVNTLRAKTKSLKGVAAEKISGSGISNVLSDLTPAGLAKANVKEAADTALYMVGDLGDYIAAAGDDAKFTSISYSSERIEAAKTSAPEGLVWDIVYEISGNKIIQLVPKTAVKGSAAFDAAAKYSVNVEKGDKKESGEIAALDQTAIGKTLDAVEAKVRELMNNKAVIASVQVKLDGAIADIAKVVSQVSGEDKEAGSRSTKARSAVTAFSNGAIKLITYTGSETTRVCQAYLTYAERSIGSFGEKKEEKK